MAVGLLLWAGATHAFGEDWPQFLGLRQDGTSLETGLVRSIPTNGLPILWDRPIGTGYSAPSLISGMLVTFHREKNEEIIEALDPATGASRWRHGYPSAYRDPYGYNNGPRCAPILTEQRVYTFGAEGKLTWARPIRVWSPLIPRQEPRGGNRWAGRTGRGCRCTDGRAT